MRKDKVQDVKENGYQFDDAAVKFAELSDEEALERIQQVKERIKELRGLEGVSKDPQKIWELRELQTSLAWMKANKNRSKFFKVEGGTFDSRRARRHPDVNIFRGKTNNDNRKKRRTSKRQKRQGLQISESVFSRTYRENQEAS